MELTESTARWEPILPDNLIAPAREAICAIAQDLCKLVPQSLTPLTHAQLALFFAYLTQAKLDGPWESLTLESLDRTIDSVSATSHKMPVGLHNGLAGAGWILDHVSQILAPVNDDTDDASGESQSASDDPLSELDREVVRRLEEGVGRYDLCGGLVGIGVYLLARLPNATAVSGLTLIFDQLRKRMVRCWPGFTWHTPPGLLSPTERDRFPGGYYDLGVAHGVPGIIYIIEEIRASECILKPKRHIVRMAIEWLLARQRLYAAGSRYAKHYVKGQEGEDSPLGWCYGDLGIAAVLHHVDSRISTPLCRHCCSELLDRCLAWPDGKTGAREACLCHGAAGVAHIFNRLYQKGGDARYKEASCRWFEQVLSMRAPGAGVGGYTAVDSQHDGIPLSSSSFLTGSVGIGLALLAAIVPWEPQWDRLLLISGRPSGIEECQEKMTGFMS
jgi:hypothetical protein